MKLIIGLGNPGKDYETTRHNVGFMVVDNYAKHYEMDWKFDKKFNAEIVKTKHCILAKPQTFMNNSGLSVAAITRFYKIKPDEVLLIHDDVDMELGKLRSRNGGSSGGHRGVQSVIEHLKSQSMNRLKIGIGRNKRIPTDAYVTSKFTAEESKTIKKLLPETVAAIEKYLLKSD